MCYSRRCSISRRFNDRTQHKFHPVTPNLLHTAGFTTAPALNPRYLREQRKLLLAPTAGPRCPAGCVRSDWFCLSFHLFALNLPLASTSEARLIFTSCATPSLNSSLSNVTALTLVRRLEITTKKTTATHDPLRSVPTKIPTQGAN